MASVLPPGQRPDEHPDVLSPVFWRDGKVVLLRQRRLPDEEIWTAYDNWEDLARAIAEMEVRGAPAIGCAAAFAAALAWRAQASPTILRAVLRAIGATRPTAVNLGAALHRIANAIASERDLDRRSRGLPRHRRARRGARARRRRRAHALQRGRARDGRLRHGPRRRARGRGGRQARPRARRRDAAFSPRRAPHGVGALARGYRLRGDRRQRRRALP